MSRPAENLVEIPRMVTFHLFFPLFPFLFSLSEEMAPYKPPPVPPEG
jgi:hypothetical protein